MSKKTGPELDGASPSLRPDGTTETRIAEVSRKDVLTEYPILTTPEARRMCVVIARLQAENYREALERHERYIARSGTLLGPLWNLFDEWAKYEPELTRTAYAAGTKIDPHLVDIFPESTRSEALRKSWQLLDQLYSTGLLQPVTNLAPRNMGGGVVGVRIVNQELFDAVK